VIPELAHYALVLAFVLALAQTIVPAWGAARNDAVLMGVATPAALAGLFFVLLAFAGLVVVSLQADFSVAVVFAHSHSAMPLIYKVTGVWGNHEGSMLLWVLVLALFSALVALFGSNLPDRLRAHVLSVQGAVSTAFLLFVLATSNPFARLDPPPAEGRDLNPILQDLALAIHPPLLYLGYVGFSVTFAFAAAALIEGKIDAAWARWVRPWALAAWCFLTLGIAVGSYWAYYELGWGGYWFWDPVENASFMPWLAGTALLHSALVVEKRDALKVWTVLLAILTFSLSLLGTFLVRSGVLTSVHTFASDPTRGVFILAILTLFIGGSLALFAWRAPMLRQGGLFAPVSREGALVLNNLLLSAAAATVLVGTLYPLVLEAITGDKISVGAPFFERTAAPLLLALALALPFGPMLAWKRGDLLGAAQRLVLAAAMALAAAGASFVLAGGSPLAALGLFAAIFAIGGALSELSERTALLRVPLSSSLTRARGLPRSSYGTALAHMGVGIALLGIVSEGAWSEEKIVALRAGERLTIARLELDFRGIARRDGPNYREEVGRFEVRRGGVVAATLEPSKRVYLAGNRPTTEAGIATFGLGQLYVTLGDPAPDGSISARIYWKPLVTLIWIGAAVMAFGGALSLSDRRLRIGAPRRAARSLAAPAE
jgi:cytochrome c-type biogenesis protein CcmF